MSETKAQPPKPLCPLHIRFRKPSEEPFFYKCMGDKCAWWAHSNECCGIAAIDRLVQVADRLDESRG